MTTNNRLFNPFVESILKYSGILVFPSIGNSIIDLLNTEISQKKLTSLIIQDVGLSTAILQKVNCAFFSLPGEITDVERAVNLLGTNKTFALAFTSVISTQLGSMSANSDLSAFSETWRRSILTGLIYQFNYKSMTIAYITGLIKYIGMMVFIDSYQEKYIDLINKSFGDINLIRKYEENEFETTFDLVSYWISEQWNLPTNISSTINPCQKNIGLEDSVSIANSIILYSRGEVDLSALNPKVKDFLSDRSVVIQSHFDDKFSVWFDEIKKKYFMELCS